MLFSINLVCMAWLCAYTYAEGEGFEGHIQRLSNISAAADNASCDASALGSVAC